MKRFINQGQQECYELERCKDTSLVFLPHNEVTPYAIVCNLDYVRGDWYCGNYFYSLLDAIADYRKKEDIPK